MSRKDYQALAEALGASVDLDEAVARISAVLLADNPRFDSDKFRAAVVAKRVEVFC